MLEVKRWTPKKVLLATDFSEHSNAARQFATVLARDSGATLLIAHVIEPPPHSADAGFGGYKVVAEDEATVERQLLDVVQTDPKVDWSHKLLHGAPAQEIVKYAAEEGADMIVIGSHGRRGLMRMLLGSVAENIVRSAKCPVLTIKQPTGGAKKSAALVS